MKVGMYPGSFDPLTFGHVDIVNRALKIFDKVIILVSYNQSKKHTFFTPEERLEMITKLFKDESRVEVIKYDGLTIDACKKNNAVSIIRGLRMLTDFEYEYSMALTNKKLDEEVESVYFMTSVEYTYLSSSMVKEVFNLGADVEEFVPEIIVDYMKKKRDKIKK